MNAEAGSAGHDVPSGSRSSVWVTVALVAAAFALSAFAYPRLPEIVADHWDLSGNVNGHGSRLLVALITPCIMLAIAAILIFLPRADDRVFIRYDGDSAGRPGLRRVYGTIAVTVLAFLLGIHALTLSAALGITSSSQLARIITMLLSLLLIIVGNYLPLVTRRNAFIGVRFPWTYASDEVWRKSQRAGGYALVSAGVVGLVALIVAPHMALLMVLAVVLVGVVGTGVYSYALAHEASA